MRFRLRKRKKDKKIKTRDKYGKYTTKYIRTVSPSLSAFTAPYAGCNNSNKGKSSNN